MFDGFRHVGCFGERLGVSGAQGFGLMVLEVKGLRYRARILI